MTTQDSVKPTMKGISVKDKEVRKIQFTGRSTYQLSLPKRWVKEMNLEAGDSVTIVRQANNSLSIVPNIVRETEEIAEAMVNMKDDENEASLARKLISVYLHGYNMIHVRCKEGLTPKQRDIVKSILKKNLIGTEIMSDSANHLTIQVMVSLAQVTVSSIVRRMMVITSSMFKNILSALANSERQLAEHVVRADDEIDRFSFYTIRNISIAMRSERILREIGFETPLEALFYRTLARSIEEIADNLCAIARVILLTRTEKEDIKQIIDAGNATLILFENAVEAFLRKNYDLADKVIEKIHGLKAMQNMIKVETGSQDLVVQRLDRIMKHIEEIAETTLNQSVSKTIQL